MSIILIDDRERASGICAQLAALHQAYCIQRLAVADYVVNHALYVERKTAVDFMASLADQRLFSQVARMRADNHRAVMIVEGAHLPNRPAVMGALCSLATQWCVPVLRSKDLAQTAWLLARMACHADAHAAPVLRCDYHRKHGRQSVHQKMLTLIPGLGPRKARALTDVLHTVHGVLTAARGELLRVPGVGPRLADRILSLRTP